MEKFKKLSFGSTILFTITVQLKMTLSNIQSKIVGSVLIEISPCKYSPTMPLPKRFHQICEAAMTPPRTNGLKYGQA